MKGITGIVWLVAAVIFLIVVRPLPAQEPGGWRPGTPKRQWGPEQALGPPDTNRAGDIPTAWASLTPDGQDEWLQLTFGKAVVPRMVLVYETFNPGAVMRVSVFDAAGKETTAWEGTDPLAVGSGHGVARLPVTLGVSTRKIRVHLASKRVPGWNEIDAVALVGADGAKQWATAAMASSTYAERPARRFQLQDAPVQQLVPTQPSSPAGVGLLLPPRQRHLNTPSFLKTLPAGMQGAPLAYPVLANDDGRAVVPATRLWSDTGLTVAVGQQIRISGTGQVRGCSGPIRDWAFGPWGPAGSLCYGTEYEGHALCALIGKIETADGPEEFLVGEQFAFAAPVSGRLFLGVSDINHRDNEGAFLARVSVDGRDVDFRDRVALLHAVLRAGPELVPADAIRMTHVDESAEHRKSLAGSGHAVWYERPAATRFVEAIDICAARYGKAVPPETEFHVYLLNTDLQTLAHLRYPYAMISRGELAWYTLRTPSVEVPARFLVVLAFSPHRSTGIFLGQDDSVTESHSLTGLPGEPFEPVTEPLDWAVRVHATPRATGVLGTRRLADWTPPDAADPFADCHAVEFAGGTPDGRQSYGGRGPAVRFKLAEHLPDGIDARSLAVVGIQVFANRYGAGYDPERAFIEMSLVDADGNELHRQLFPYSLFKRQPDWVDLELDEPIPVRDLPSLATPWLVAVNPGAGRYRGVYFHYRAAPANPLSLYGTVTHGFRQLDDRQWMMRLVLR